MEKLKITYLIISLGLFSWNVNAQSAIDSTEIKESAIIKITPLNIYNKSRYNMEGAEKDILNNKMRMLFLGGLGGMPDFNNENDSVFQKKYKVELFS